jgi:hypothetical protein
MSCLLETSEFITVHTNVSSNQSDSNIHRYINGIKHSKAILVTGNRCAQGCEKSMIPHSLENQLTDVGEVISLTHLQRFTTQEGSWYSFLLEAESTPGPECGLRDCANWEKNPNAF